MAANSDSEDDSKFFADLLGKQKLKAGASIAAKSSRSKENKQKAGVTGGGSFQSMGGLGLDKFFLVLSLLSSSAALTTDVLPCIQVSRRRC